MNAFFSVLYLPGMMLHGKNLQKHPYMALSGTMVNVLMIWQLCHHEHESQNKVLEIVYKLSMAEFLHSFYHIFDDNHKRQSLKYVLFLTIVCSESPFSYGLLYVYAAYVASLAPCFLFHLHYILFHAILQFMELQVLAHVCMFIMMASAYQIADICDFIREVEIDAA